MEALGRKLAPHSFVLIFASLSLLFGCVFAFAVPVGWGPDEVSQFDRAFQVSQGQIAPVRLPSTTRPRYGGQVPLSSRHVAAFQGPSSIPEPHPWDRLFTSSPGYRSALNEPLNSPLVTASFANTSAYSPAPYVPAATGLSIASALDLSIGTAWHLARLFQVLAYTAVTALGLIALRRSRFRWMALPLALLPTAIYQSAVISADALTNAVAFTFLALLAKAVVLHRETPDNPEESGLSGWETYVLLISTVLLPLMKPTYVILSLLVFLVPASRLLIGRHLAPRALGTKVALTVTAVLTGLAFAWWMALSSGTASAMGSLQGVEAQTLTINPSSQAHFIFTHPLAVVEIVVRTFVDFSWTYVSSFFGQMGYALGQNLATSAFGALCTLIALVIGLFYGPRGSANRSRTAILVAVWIVSVMAIFATIYLTFEPVGTFHISGVQGRYFVPLALLASAVAIQIVPMRFTDSARTAVHVQRSIYGLSIAALVLALIQYVTVMYAGGYPHL